MAWSLFRRKPRTPNYERLVWPGVVVVRPRHSGGSNHRYDRRGKILMRVEGILEVGERKLGLAFECDEADEPTFMRRARALRWSLVQTAKSLRGEFGPEQQALVEKATH